MADHSLSMGYRKAFAAIIADAASTGQVISLPIIRCQLLQCSGMHVCVPVNKPIHDLPQFILQISTSVKRMLDSHLRFMKEFGAAVGWNEPE